MGTSAYGLDELFSPQDWPLNLTNSSVWVYSIMISDVFTGPNYHASLHKGGIIMNHKSSSVILFILYIVLLGCMLAHKDMLAMWLMTFGMLIEASINLYDQFKRPR